MPCCSVLRSKQPSLTVALVAARDGQWPAGNVPAVPAASPSCLSLPEPYVRSPAASSAGSNAASEFGGSDILETPRLEVDHLKGNMFVNQFLVLKDLGRGSHGSVRLCLDTRDMKLYAMKVIQRKRARRNSSLLQGLPCHASSLDSSAASQAAPQSPLQSDHQQQQQQPPPAWLACEPAAGHAGVQRAGHQQAAPSPSAAPLGYTAAGPPGFTAAALGGSHTRPAAGACACTPRAVSRSRLSPGGGGSTAGGAASVSGDGSSGGGLGANGTVGPSSAGRSVTPGNARTSSAAAAPPMPAVLPVHVALPLKAAAAAAVAARSLASPASACSLASPPATALASPRAGLARWQWDLMELSGLDPSVDPLAREMAVMKKLDHPNVVRLHEVIHDAEEKVLVLVMEYLPGGPILAPSLAGGPQCTEPLAALYFRDVVRGLHYLHQHGVVHGDVKPANLLLSAAGRVKLTDFGSCAVVPPGGMMRASLGTPAFIAPEACGAHACAFDPFAAEVWALGVTLYCLLYGSPPFTADCNLNLYERIREAEALLPPLPGGEPPSAPLVALLRGLLRKDPAQRMKLTEAAQHEWVLQGGVLPPLLLENAFSGGNGAAPNPGSHDEESEGGSLADRLSGEEAASGLTALEAHVRGLAGVEERTYKRGAVLIRKGDAAEGLFLIRRGVCQVVMEGEGVADARTGKVVDEDLDFCSLLSESSSSQEDDAEAGRSETCSPRGGWQLAGSPRPQSSLSGGSGVGAGLDCGVRSGSSGGGAAVVVRLSAAIRRSLDLSGGRRPRDAAQQDTAQRWPMPPPQALRSHSETCQHARVLYGSAPGDLGSRQCATPPARGGSASGGGTWAHSGMGASSSGSGSGGFGVGVTASTPGGGGGRMRRALHRSSSMHERMKQLVEQAQARTQRRRGSLDLLAPRGPGDVLGELRVGGPGTPSRVTIKAKTKVKVTLVRSSQAAELRLAPAVKAALASREAESSVAHALDWFARLAGEVAAADEARSMAALAARVAGTE